MTRLIPKLSTVAITLSVVILASAGAFAMWSISTGVAHAQNASPLDPWVATSSPVVGITQRTKNQNLVITGITTGLCLTLNSNKTLTSTACGTGAPYPFTPSTYGTLSVSATSTAINDSAGFVSTASSTLFKISSEFSTSTNATSTTFDVSGTLTVGSLSGLLKGSNGVVTTGSNGTDYTLITAKTCNAGDFASAVTAAGVFTCTTPASGSAYAFTPTTNYNIVMSATSTALWARAGLFASSTSAFDQINVGSTTVGTMSTSTFFGNLSVRGNASSTGLTVSGTRSALLLADAVGSVSAYGGASACSANNFVTTLTAVGGTACGTASITINGGSVALGGSVTVASTTLLSNSNTYSALTLQQFANASTSLFSVFTTAYFGGSSTTTINNIGSITLPTAALLTAPYATTTSATVSNAFYMPSLAACTATSGSGFSSLCLDTTNKQIEFTNGANLYAVTATSSRGFNIGSTTLDAMGKTFNTATSSFALTNMPDPITLLGWYCVASTTGTAIVNFRHANGTITNSATCTTGAYTVATANTTWTSFESLTVDASSTSPTNPVSRITVTPVWTLTPQ